MKIYIHRLNFNNLFILSISAAFCNVAVNMDDVALHISEYNKHLVSLDMWKAHFLSANGVMALSKCHDLEEVDFGWW